MGNNASAPTIADVPIGGTPILAPGAPTHSPSNKTRPGALSHPMGASPTTSTSTTNAKPLTGVNRTESGASTPPRNVKKEEPPTPEPMKKKFEKPTEKVAPAPDKDPSKMSQSERDMFDYQKLRDDLFAFSLGEAAYQYAERLNNETPNNPALMALLGETAYLYEKLKNKGRREHWVDRLDVLQRGIDVSRKCMNDHPDYGPCWRSYVLCAAKLSDTEIWFKRWKPLSLFKHYNRLQAIGDHALELQPSSDTAMCLAAVAGRCATRIRHWYSPWHPVARWYNIPYQRDLLIRAKDLLEKATELEPENVEMTCRLAEVWYELGDMNKARRLYVKVRDEMQPPDPGQAIWQAVAHTHLISHFDKPEWNIPFG
jgi:tetratricopeptide (TPR) repeat protein